MAELVIQNPSITSGAFASMLAFSSDNNTITAISGHPIAGVGGGGTPVEGYWRPSVNADGDISWQWSLESTATAPSTANIKGPQGIQGETGPRGPSGTNGKDGTNGTNGKDGYSVELQSVTDEDGGKKVTLSWGETPSTSSFVIPSGAKGADGQNGQNGKNGISPTFTITPTAGGTHVTISGAQGQESFDVLSGAKGADGQDGQKGADGDDGYSPEVSTTTITDGERTGTEITFTFGEGGLQTTSYSAWNGKDGTGATITLSGGKGIQIDHVAGSTEYGISVSADYMTEVSADSTLSGDGTSEHPLGVDTSKTYSLDGVDPIIVTSGAGNKTIIKATDAAVSALNAVAQNKSVWDSASAKSTVTVNPANNEIKVEGSPNSAVSAAVYYPRTSNGSLFAAQRIFMVETDADIYQCMTHTDGQGCLFFMLSARS